MSAAAASSAAISASTSPRPPPPAVQFSSALSSSSTSAEASEQRAAPASLSSLLEVCVDGRCSRRLQWEEVELLVKAGRLEALGRLDHQLADYAKSKAAMLCDYHSVVDRLREHRLGAPCRLVDGRKKCDWTEEAEDAAAQQQAGAGGDGQTAEAGEANHELAETDEGKQIRLCWYPNEFGYAIAGDVEHHLVWSDRFLDPHSRLFERSLAQHRPAREYDVVLFINPPHLRSIPDLHHIHVFSRKKHRGTA